MKGEYKGERYNDTDVYKTIEGASYSLMVHPDPALDRYLDGVIAKIAAAQEPDGYLVHAADGQSGHSSSPGSAQTRWAELAISHELYNAGHLYEAAAAHFQATGKRTLLGRRAQERRPRRADVRAGAGKAAGLPRTPGDRDGPRQALPSDGKGRLTWTWRNISWTSAVTV